MPPIILASASPRRKELLALTGLPFVIVPVNVEEIPVDGESPAACVNRLSELKMRAAVETANRMGFSGEQFILSSDTIVAYQGEILGKPRNNEDARRMLLMLRGQTHQVYTGIQLAKVDTSQCQTDICISDVPMRNYTDQEIDDYIASGDPMDKAGAYAIQHPEFHPVDSFSHCYASVMGLPLCHLNRSLIRLGIKIYEDIPVACQHALQYNCPVYSAIMNGS